MNSPALLAALLLAAPPAVQPKPGRIAYCGTGVGGYGVHVVTPDGKPVAAVTKFGEERFPEAARRSHDGTRVVVFAVGKAPGQDELTGDVQVYDLARPDKPLAILAAGLPRHSCALAWGADTATVYVNQERGLRDERGNWVPLGWAVTRYDVAIGKGAAVGLPADHAVADASPDGKTLLVRSVARNAYSGDVSSAHLADAATLKLRPLKAGVRPYRFSPDGLRVVGAREAETVDGTSRRVVLDVKTGAEAPVRLGGRVFGAPPRAAWSPDGARLLVARTVHATGAEYERQKGVRYVPTVDELFLCAPDGSGVTPAFGKERGRWLEFDWR